MSDTERELAREKLIYNLSELPAWERREIGLAMRWYWEGHQHKMPNQLKETFKEWLWTYEDWAEIMKRSAVKRRRDMRRTHKRRIKDKTETKRKKKAAYMRGYMKSYRARKSIDEQEGD